jgi:hypothetical protein
MSDKPHFITVYRSMGGWKALELWWNPEGFWEPWQTGLAGYEKREDAVEEAKFWAESEGLQFRDSTKEPKTMVVRRRIFDRDPPGEDLIEVEIEQDPAGIKATTTGDRGNPPGVLVELKDHERRLAEAILGGTLS